MILIIVVICLGYGCSAGVNASLIKEEDLKPTIHDLDNLFASDSDASDSDMVSLVLKYWNCF